MPLHSRLSPVFAELIFFLLGKNKSAFSIRIYRVLFKGAARRLPDISGNCRHPVVIDRIGALPLKIRNGRTG
jgi:hypothetical protein